MDEFDRRDMRAYLDRPLDDLLGELSDYDTTKGLGDVWQKIAGPVRMRLCEGSRSRGSGGGRR